MSYVMRWCVDCELETEHEVTEFRALPGHERVTCCNDRGRCDGCRTRLHAPVEPVRIDALGFRGHLCLPCNLGPTLIRVPASVYNNRFGDTYSVWEGGDWWRSANDSRRAWSSRSTCLNAIKEERDADPQHPA